MTEDPVAGARGIINAVFLVLAGLVFVFLGVLTCDHQPLHAAPPTRLEFTIPTVDNKGTCNVPVDTVGAPGYRRAVIYRSSPGSPLVPIDSIGGGWFAGGSLVSLYFGQPGGTKPIPFGAWCFTSSLYDSAGNTCGPEQATGMVVFDGRPPRGINNMVVK